MASNITTNIDENYPVAGQDNDTQGFRDNFATLKTSLIAAKSEIEDLQEKAVLKSALIDDTLSNDMQNNTVTRANLAQSTQQVNLGGTLSENNDLSFLQGHYQVFSFAGPTHEFTLTGFPAEGYAKMLVELTSSNEIGGTTTVTFQYNGTLHVSPSWPSNPGGNEILVGNATNPVLIEFWVRNFGESNEIFANYLGQYNAVV